MRKVTATEKYRAVNEGKMAKGEFVRQMRLAYPSVISQFNGYDDTVQILKNKGYVFEAQEEQHNFSDEAVRRGMDVEIAAMGHDPVTCKDEEAQEKAKAKVLKNLKKDPLHYLNLLSGESSKVDKHDKYQEVKKNNHKDTFNDMKKAELKEGKFTITESNKETIVDLIGYLKTKKGASSEEVKDFLKTHWADMRDDIVSGKMDLEDIEHEFDNFISVNYDSLDEDPNEVMGIDRKGNKKPETDGSNAAKYKRAAKGMKEEFQPGDMWSKDFDYKGMLKAGLMIPEPDGQPSGEEIEHMMKISDSFEDVNYHTENGFLQDAIDAYQHEDEQAGLESLKQFKKAISQTISTLKEIGGQFVREDEKEYLAKKDAAIKKAMGKEDEVNEYRGSGEDIKSIIRDKAADSGFSEQEEAMEVMEFIGQEYEIDFEFGAGPSRQAEAKEKIQEVNIPGDQITLFDALDKYSIRDIMDAAVKYIGKQSSGDMGDYVLARKMAAVDRDAWGDTRNRFEEAKEKIQEANIPGDQITLFDALDKYSIRDIMDAAVKYLGKQSGGDLDDYMLAKKMAGVDRDAWGDTRNRGFEEAKGKDHDGDGDIDGDDYMAAKDKAIKKAMGKDKAVRENLKAIISKVLEEQVISEAATNQLAKIADEYAGFEGMKSSILDLQNIVSDIEGYYDKTRDKIQKVYDKLGEIRNEEGLKVGGFLAPAIEAAFRKDLNPVTKLGFVKGLSQPKVRVLSQADIDAHNSGDRPLGETDVIEEPKQHIFTPVNEKKK